VNNAAALGFRSELIFHRADGEVLDWRAEHGCRVIRTPVNPTFYWGNYLLFDRAPTAGDAVRWPRLFERFISSRQPESTHRAFGWIENSRGDITPFLEDGYQINNAAVMVSTRVPETPRPSLAARLQAFGTTGREAESEWSQLVALHVATRAPQFEEQGYWPYARRSVERWRALAAAGRGNWFGAFVERERREPELVAALGIYAEAEPEKGERIARYQAVMTAAAHRRRGLCRALIAQAARYAIEELGADRLIIVAAAGEMPEQLYAKVGFVAAGLQRGLQRLPERSRP
jgi:GNAT superfamily N-acetyltransferase